VSEDVGEWKGLDVSRQKTPPKIKNRTALYYWRLLRQLPWLVLRYRL
jgi:hypothetical protein